MLISFHRCLWSSKARKNYFYFFLVLYILSWPYWFLHSRFYRKCPSNACKTTNIYECKWRVCKYVWAPFLCLFSGFLFWFMCWCFDALMLFEGWGHCIVLQGSIEASTCGKIFLLCLSEFCFSLKLNNSILTQSLPFSTASKHVCSFYRYLMI